MTNIIIIVKCYYSLSNVIFEKSLLVGYVCSVYRARQVRFVISENPKITNTLSENRRTFPIATRRCNSFMSSIILRNTERVYVFFGGGGGL